MDLRKSLCPGTGAGIKDITFDGLYVGWTRVSLRKGADIRVIPPQDGANDAFYHLMKLGPSAHLISLSWLNGFVSVDAEQALSWDQNLAASIWLSMARNNAEHVRPASRSNTVLSAESRSLMRSRANEVSAEELLQYSAEQIRALTVPTLLAILRALGVRNTGNRSVLVGGNCLADTFGALQRYQQDRGQEPGARCDSGSAARQGMENIWACRAE